ncbi:pectinesterase-like [Aristolochia californica]|uniref:pectinesterase-like n=1 Tax=Aristolochia californica TaxID=171875 RepID=UPI0035DDD479
MASAPLFILSFPLLLPLLFQSLSSENHFVKGDRVIQTDVQRETGEGDQPNISNRRLLAGLSGLNANAVVAQNGRGNYRTIQEAVDKAPKYSTRRYVIYIKTGEYVENVVVPQEKWNLTFAGDGKKRTILTSNKAGSILTSGALVVLGDGFFARDMAFVSKAGPQQGQAVAMRSDSHRSAFFRCSFLGYQDTLFANINHQFYRSCDIVGTIDFIFGDASVVFQNCNIYARRPLNGQANVIIAQGKTDPITGGAVVLQNCHITALENLGSVKTYLGRPWQKFSTAIVMESFLDKLIEPAGWLEAMGANERITVKFREYANTGPGSNTQKRVKWGGYKTVTNTAEVKQYTVAAFIHGNHWLPALRVPFKAGL